LTLEFVEKQKDEHENHYQQGEAEIYVE